MKPSVRTRAPFSCAPVAQIRRASPVLRDVVRFNLPALTDVAQIEALLPPATPSDPGATPFVDYGCTFTNEGGIRITYKDIDARLRHTIWRLSAWMSFTGFEGWFLHAYPPAPHPFACLICFCVAACVNWRIVGDPVLIMRSVEVRPDCMILDGVDFFWLAYMQGTPQFQNDEAGNPMLCGIYGTRWIHYLTILRFDERDRSPEVFRMHFEAATAQLWTPTPY